MYSSGDDVGAVVADIGTHATRIGFAGDDSPRGYFPTSLGREIAESSDGNHTYKFDLHGFRENIEVISPVQEGLVKDWDAIEQIWNHTATNSLQIDLRQTPVLIAEKPYNPPENRHKYCELMFETFATPAVFLAKDTVLACFACGKTGGVVCDVGGSGSVVTAITEGWIDPKATNRGLVGGNAMDLFFLRLLEADNTTVRPLYSITKHIKDDGTVTVNPRNLASVHPSFDAYHRLQTVREVREAVCRMADSQFAENDHRLAHVPAVPYELPDGTLLEVGINRFKVPEVLMDPTPLVQLDIISEVQGESYSHMSALEPIHRLICDSIVRCDAEVQSTMANNLIICGGTACIEGSTDRIRNEVERIIHTSSPAWRVKMMTPGQNERAICAWLGGSILASLGQFHEMWIAKSEYEEHGARLVDRKCP